jgi:glycerate 2-kinase
MARAAAGVVAERLRRALLVSTEATPAPPGFDSLAGGHPIPTPGSEAAGRCALAIAAGTASGETLLVLLSGGASALMAVPASGVTLEDKRRTTERLLRAGTDIHALNTVRKHLSAIKGGQLAASAGGGCRTFAISDVVGDDLSVIASGPTVPDTSTFGDALGVLERFGGINGFPPAVAERLRRGAAGAVQETPKPGDVRLAHATARVIGGGRDAMAGAARAARALDYEVVIVDEPVVGEARTAARAHVGRIRSIAPDRGRPLCVVSGGETTVHVAGRGRGGRNQEFVLAVSADLESLGGTAVAASVGTDGIDGPTAAAGAIADLTTLERARAAGVSPERALAENDAGSFFAAIGDLITTGPTDTNVGDLQIFLLA